MTARRCASATPHSLISSRDRKQPRHVSSSSRQQFRIQGDGAALSVSPIAVKLVCDWPVKDLSTRPEGNPGNGSHGRAMLANLMEQPDTRGMQMSIAATV